ncbi:MAG: hypothetical protein JJLCMIEE_00341 [Acidimicrobiales bacterium]|nr:hypothetical protein [Acidimicrobiales bacterium]
MITLPGLFGLGVATAAVGTLGGIGGAVILVPALVLAGVEPAQAAPLGLLSVAAGSLAASAGQLDEGLVHQRLGVTIETSASAGAILGALVSVHLDATALTRVLAAVALASAIAGVTRRRIRNLPRAAFAHEVPGEWPGTLAGQYSSESGIVPYQARRIPLGLVLMALSGLVAGLAGVGGGFIKTPVMREIMHVPVKVAAATSTFSVGITAAAGLLVFTAQGRVDWVAGAAVVAGGLLGGVVGASVQRALSVVMVRAVLSALLVVVSAVLLVQA